jgi:hypothetical protein
VLNLQLKALHSVAMIFHEVFIEDQQLAMIVEIYLKLNHRNNKQRRTFQNPITTMIIDTMFQKLRLLEMM